MWHQALLCDEGKRLGISFYAFRSSVATSRQVGPSPNAVKWEDKPGAEDAVFGLLTDITVRHNFDDVVKIPERMVYTVPFEMPPNLAKAYFQMEQAQYIDLKGKRDKGQIITAIHAASVRGKLLQIASGAVYGDASEASNDKPTHLLDTARYELAMDLAEESPHTLLMFLWKHQRDHLIAEAQKRKLSYAVLDGSTPTKVRESIEKDYQAGKYDVLIAHPKTVAHGLTLTLGTTTIWVSPTDDTEWFKQGNRRQARRGQKNSTRVITLIAEGTVDQKAYDNCINKGAREDIFLGLFERYEPAPAAPVAKPRKKAVPA